MSLHKSSTIAAVVLVISFGLFLWFGHAADRAMDKNGVGNLGAWETFNVRAGIAFWSFVAAWVLAFAFAFYRHGDERSQLLAVCGLSLAAAPALWFISSYSV